ncbi:EamA family transporter [Pseudomonas sp. 18175]|uniref:EamA family transporter n=1 Tax=Pseudomonas sp. 18175 TaxID=3390056 RepID=UPI003D2380C7
MSIVTVLLVVLAAVIHATWNLLAKRAADVGAAFVFAYTLLGCVVYAPWVVWILWRDGMPWSLAVLLCIVLSGVLHLGYNLSLQRGYQVADLSVVYPVARGTGPAVATVGAIVLLGEPAGANALVGVGAVVIGIVLIAARGRWSRFKQSQALAGIRWGAASGVLIASYSVVDAYGVKVLLIAPVVLDWCAHMVRLGLLLPWAIAQRQHTQRAMKGYWVLALLVGTLSPMSYILVLVALSEGAPLSVVAPVREMSMMIGAVLAVVILHEPMDRGRLVGCVLLTLGVVLLVLS